MRGLQTEWAGYLSSGVRIWSGGAWEALPAQLLVACGRTAPFRHTAPQRETHQRQDRLSPAKQREEQPFSSLKRWKWQHKAWAPRRWGVKMAANPCPSSHWGCSPSPSPWTWPSDLLDQQHVAEVTLWYSQGQATRSLTSPTRPWNTGSGIPEPPCLRCHVQALWSTGPAFQVSPQVPWYVS